MLGTAIIVFREGSKRPSSSASSWRQIGALRRGFWYPAGSRPASSARSRSLFAPRSPLSPRHRPELLNALILLLAVGCSGGTISGCRATARARCHRPSSWRCRDLRLASSLCSGSRGRLAVLREGSETVLFSTASPRVAVLAQGL